MTKVKLLKEDSSGNISVVDINAAEVSRDGLRAVDSGVFTCPSRISISQGNVIKFISDVADTKHLRGAYLFHGSCLDESGYNVDPVNQTNPSVSGFTNWDGLDYETNSTSSSKFYNFHQGTVPSNGGGAILENKTMPNSDPVHDFSSDFDIICWVTTGGTSGGVVYSKTNRTSFNGNDIGITIALLKQSSTSNWRVSVYLKNNSGGSLKSGSTSYQYPDGQTLCLRIQRKGSTVNVWGVQSSNDIAFGTPDATITNATGNFNSTKQAVIGANPSTFSGDTVLTTTNKFGGKLHSIRIYCGGTLDIDSANQIFASRPIPLIMKLAGNVWKIDSNLDQKKIYVKGFGKVITDTLITDEILDGSTATGEYYHTGASRSTVSFTSAYPVEIIRAIFAKLNEELSSNGNYKLSLLDLTGSSNTINSYNAVGNLLEIINQLMMIVDKSFYVSPRGRCIIENKDIDLTYIKFKNGTYQITADGFDDSNTANDLYIFTGATGNFSFVREYDQTSIDTIGLYAKRIILSQFTDATAVGYFKNNFISQSKNINTRYTIEAPFMLDFIKENFQIKIINSIKSLDASSTIKSITWKYPEAKTIIETGDYLLDAFDLERVSADTINNLFTDKQVNG